MSNTARDTPLLCKPGRECLRCQYSDCQNQNARTTTEETEMLNCAGLKSIWAIRGNYIARARRKRHV